MMIFLKLRKKFKNFKTIINHKIRYKNNHFLKNKMMP